MAAVVHVCLQVAEDKHYVPLGYLLKHHWHGLILQTGYEACKYRLAYLLDNWHAGRTASGQHVATPATNSAAPG